jgi:hypothetical protein
MSPSYVASRVEQRAMADYIVDSVIGDATGAADGARCVGEPPSARYYLSALAPRDLDLTTGAARRGRVTPTSAGFEFEVEEGCVLTADAACAVYYRVFPSYEEQLVHSDPQATSAERRGRTYRLVPVFMRRDIEVPELVIPVDPAQPHQSRVPTSSLRPSAKCNGRLPKIRGPTGVSMELHER